MATAAELERLCYGGETLLEAVELATGVVGVTSHRVLVLTPEGEGPRFRALDRPNVTGVTAGTDGPTGHRDRALKAGAGAGALLLLASVVDLGGLIRPLDPPTGAGLRGIAGILDLLIAGLGLVDEALALAGLLALLAALGSAAWYLRRRDRVIELSVAGRDPLRVPVSGNPAGAASRIEAALEESRGSAAGGA